MAVPKMRHCFCCGCELGEYVDHHELDTCGKPECEKATRDYVRDERDGRWRNQEDRDY